MRREMVGLRRRLLLLSKRHCEPPGRREAPLDDKLRDAIHLTP
jgi:hypothetical protein